MSRIVLSTSSYGYWSAGRAIDLSEALSARGHEVTVLAGGSAQSLLSRSPEVRLVSLPLDRRLAAARMIEVIRHSDVLVSLMAPLSISVAQKMSVRTVWIDSMLHFWSSIPTNVRDVDLYVYQRCLESDDELRAAATSIRNFVAVGPLTRREIVAKPSLEQDGIRLLINFSGVGDLLDTGYELAVKTAQMLVQYLVSRLEAAPIHSAHFAGPGNVFDLDFASKPSNISFGPLGHEQFLARLEEASVLLTVPTLGASLEAWELRKPVAFLPALNPSQFAQLGRFVSKGLVPDSLRRQVEEWTPQSVYEFDFTAQAIKQLSLLATYSNEYLDSLLDLIYNSKELAVLRQSGNRFFESLGENGLLDTVHAVEAIAGR